MLVEYKERNPKDTVSIINDFFKKKGFIIRYKYHKRNKKYGTYGCVVELFHPSYEKVVMYSNGKGVTKEFCLASGYSELYERYCARAAPNFYFHNIDKDDKKYDFYQFSKIISDSIDTFKINENNVYNFNELKELFDFLNVKKFSVSTYQNIIDGRKIKFNNLLRGFEFGTNGLAAGNTFEETFNQGISEIYERYIEEKFTSGKMKLKKISNDIVLKYNNINKIVKYLEELDYAIEIFDLSYEYGNYPVISVLIFDKLKNTYACKCACFPIFRIALERCFTEIMQGFNEFVSNRIFTNKIESKDYYENYGRMKNTSTSEITNPIIFSFEKKLINIYNQNVFLEDAIDNKQIFEYWINKIKENKDNVFFKNISECSEMYCLDIIVIDKMKKLQTEDNYIKHNLNYFMNDLNRIKDILIDNKISDENVYELRNLLLKIDSGEIKESINLLNRFLMLGKNEEKNYLQYLIFAISILTNSIIDCELRNYYIEENFSDRISTLLCNWYNLKYKNNDKNIENKLLSLGYTYEEITSFYDKQKFFELFIKKYFLEKNYVEILENIK